MPNWPSHLSLSSASFLASRHSIPCQPVHSIGSIEGGCGRGPGEGGGRSKRKNSVGNSTLFSCLPHFVFLPYVSIHTYVSRLVREAESMKPPALSRRLLHSDVPLPTPLHPPSPNTHTHTNPSPSVWARIKASLLASSQSLGTGADWDLFIARRMN